MLKHLSIPLLAVCLPCALRAQDGAPSAPERWNAFWQATSIGQYHGTFRSPYNGANSLADYTERDVSLTITLFLGLRLGPNTQIYFDPEMAGGRGFTNVTGVANFPNGELPRVASAAPKPYIARLYLSQDFALGGGRQEQGSEANQLAGSRPERRYTVSLGRFTVTDFFDNNRYSHDPRSQFLGWGVMYNGAWDYPADVRGYTWGWVHELHLKHWSLRYAAAAEPRTANGPRFDRRVFRDRGDVFEGEARYSLSSHPGAVRVLYYLNHSRAGSYDEAVRTALASGTIPNVTTTSKPGTVKYGFGVNAEQEIAHDIGIFGRFGWNDGKTQDFAFTAIDSLATAGMSVTGSRWRRANDTVAAEFTSSGLSAIHAKYLSLGGLDFIIGDGALRYGREDIFEAYYNLGLFRGLQVSIDGQHIANPAYNQDRGGLWAWSLRLHVEGALHASK